MNKVTTAILLVALIGLSLVSGCGKCSAWNITDIAVAPDGETIYIIAGKCSDSVTVYKSTDGGSSFAECTMPSDFTAPARAIAVAPDDVNRVAVVDSTPAEVGVYEGGTVWISKTGGESWEVFLPFSRVPNSSAVASTVITDIAIGPTRPGMIHGRNYLVCSGDSVEGVSGGVHTIGTGDDWEDLKIGFPIYPMDFTSCRFSPNFSSDFCFVTVGSTTEDTYQDIVNIMTFESVAHVLLEPSGVDSPGDTQIVTSDIALPSDFDPTSAAGQVSFVAWGSSSGTGDDVYRVNGTVVTKLNVLDATAGIRSIVCAGNIGSGALLAGMQANTKVYYTTDPWSASVTWSAASVPPTGESGVILAIAPDFATTHTCYAGTSGVESYFFISTDGGDTFQ